MSKYIREIEIIEMLSNIKKVEVFVASNVKIDRIVFHPSEPFIYLRSGGVWKKVKFQPVE